MAQIEPLKVEVDGITFYFKKPRANERIDGLKGQEFIQYFFSKLIRLEGEILDEEGKPISITELKEIGLPMDMVSEITRAWAAAVRALAGVPEIAEEKKITSSDSSLEPSGLSSTIPPSTVPTATD